MHKMLNLIYILIHSYLALSEIILERKISKCNMDQNRLNHKNYLNHINVFKYLIVVRLINIFDMYLRWRNINLLKFDSDIKRFKLSNKIKKINNKKKKNMRRR